MTVFVTPKRPKQALGPNLATPRLRRPGVSPEACVSEA